MFFPSTVFFYFLPSPQLVLLQAQNRQSTFSTHVLSCLRSQPLFSFLWWRHVTSNIPSFAMRSEKAVFFVERKSRRGVCFVVWVDRVSSALLVSVLTQLFSFARLCSFCVKIKSQTKASKTPKLNYFEKINSNVSKTKHGSPLCATILHNSSRISAIPH